MRKVGGENSTIPKLIFPGIYSPAGYIHRYTGEGRIIELSGISGLSSPFMTS